MATPLQLPSDLDAALRPLLQELPLDRAMGSLVVTQPPPAELAPAVEQALATPAFRDRPALAAAVWLYVDDLDRSHKISQGIEDSTGSFWHGIMHRREGDFPNSHYWFRKAGHHPAIALIDGYDPHAFIDRVEAAHRHGEAPADLVELQRREWVVLFGWCARTLSV